MLEKEVVINNNQIQNLLKKYPNDSNLRLALKVSERSLGCLEEMKKDLLNKK